MLCPNCQSKTVGKGYSVCYDCNHQRAVCETCQQRPVGGSYTKCYSCRKSTESFFSDSRRMCLNCNAKPVGDDYDHCWTCNNGGNNGCHGGDNEDNGKGYTDNNYNQNNDYDQRRCQSCGHSSGEYRYCEECDDNYKKKNCQASGCDKNISKKYSYCQYHASH